MGTVVRKHLRDFVALALLFAAGITVAYIIVQEQRLRIPVLEERPFELRAEFETAQAVVPGQGQTLRVAGVKVGDVDDVALEDGKAVVTFGVDRDYLPVYEDATILLRPTTGLKDMFFQMDPGTRSAGEIEEGGTVPLGNTAPDVNLDEILDALDGDTQAYLRVLLTGAGRGLEDRGDDLGRVLGSLGPITKDFRKLNVEVAKRKANLRRLVTNFNLLTEEVGRSERDITRLVEASSVALGAVAEQDPNVQRAVALLPGVLEDTRVALDNVSTFAAEAGPTFDQLRPFARNLDEVNTSTRQLANNVTGPIRNQIRPFVRSAREPIPDLKTAAKRLSKAAPPLTVVGKRINRLGNMAAYNPSGAEPPGTAGRDEGYLYWAAWLGHNGNSVFSTGDANGFLRRIYVTMGCDEALSLLGASPFAPLVTGLSPLFAPTGPFAGGC
ncbi:MAG TPA: MlaD family protein [Solirubrobacterales bacterium]|nr:MlaD family protein [Solirubrobacterales bacterium]